MDIERVLAAFARHGEDSEPDHEVGDLQDFIWLLWNVMTDEQKRFVQASADLYETLACAVGWEEAEDILRVNGPAGDTAGPLPGGTGGPTG